MRGAVPRADFVRDRRSRAARTYSEPRALRRAMCFVGIHRGLLIVRVRSCVQPRALATRVNGLIDERRSFEADGTLFCQFVIFRFVPH